MSKSTIGPHAPSKTQSQYCIEPSEWGIFFEKKWALKNIWAIVTLILSSTVYGWWDNSPSETTPLISIQKSTSSPIAITGENNSIIIKKNPTQLPGFIQLDANTTYGKFFANGEVHELFVRNIKGRPAVSARSLKELNEKTKNILLEENQKSKHAQ